MYEHSSYLPETITIIRNIKDNWSQITVTKLNDLKVWNAERITKMRQGYEVSKRCWQNGADRHPWCRLATTLQFIKNTLSVKWNEGKHNKVRYSYTLKTCMEWVVCAWLHKGWDFCLCNYLVNCLWGASHSGLILIY